MAEELIPLGAHCYVIDIPPVVEEEERAKAAGLHIVIDKKNMPRPTSGVVIAVGPDPLIQELVREGDTVYFSKYCLEYIHVDGKAYHILALSDLKGVKRIIKQSPENSVSQPAGSVQQHGAGDRTEQVIPPRDQSTSSPSSQ